MAASSLTDPVGKEPIQAGSNAIQRPRSLGAVAKARNSQIRVRGDGRAESGSDALSRLEFLPDFKGVD